MKLKQITRTSTFTFSPLHASPLLATGTVSGALDDTFSDESKLEFWKPDFLSSTAPFSLGEEDGEGPIVTVTEKSRFNRLGWGKEGIIAGGLENGELVLWDGAKILNKEEADVEVLRTSQHGGPVRGLDWNGIQTNLVASGGINGEVFIWDLKDPTKPYTPTPGSRSTKLDDITSIGWNKVVPYVLGGSSNTGNTVVWDLRGKREVVSLAYGSTPSGGGGGFSGGRRGTSDLAWSPDNATKVVTASESDENPVVAVWDLRNARAPEKILTGHTKGLLSLSWNTFDSSLLLTAGKDNRVLLFNPHTSTVLAELQPSNNWAFSAQFHPLNPSILGAAYFDGRIEVHSIQSTNPESFLGEEDKQGVQVKEGEDLFGAIAHHSENRPKMSPSLDISSDGGVGIKWLRRPSSVSWGFGGKLISVGNLMGSKESGGAWQSGSIHLREGVSADTVLVERAKALFPETTGAGIGDTVLEGKQGETWDALKALVKQKKEGGKVGGKEELVKLLGYDKGLVEGLVSSAVEKLKAQQKHVLEDETPILGGAKESVVSFADVVDEVGAVSAEDDEEDGRAPVEREHSEVGSEPSAGSITPSSTTGAPTSASAAPTESSTTTANSLFSLPDAPDQGGDDFFNAALTTQTPNGGVEEILVPHKITSDAMSVAATAGSRASTPAGLTSAARPFTFFPSSDVEADEDDLLTKTLLIKDWQSAAKLAGALGRWADALVFALESGISGLVEETKKAYLDFAASSGGGEDVVASSGWKGVLTQVVGGGAAEGALDRVVKGVDVSEWPHAFVLICTYAKTEEEFGRLIEELGRRIEAEGVRDPSKKLEHRKNATLTYLASRSLPSLIRLWEQELAEEESSLLSTHTPFDARSLALQTFIEKVEIFRYATDYILKASGGEERMYELYLEYAERVAGEGCLKEAKRVVRIVPDEVLSGNIEVGERVKRLGGGVGASVKAKVAVAPAVPAKSGPYVGYSAAPAVSTGPYGHPAAPAGPYGIPAAGPTFVDSSAPIQSRGGPPGRPGMYHPPPGGNPAMMSKPTPPPPTGPYAPPPGAAGHSNNVPPQQQQRPGGYAPPPPSGPYAPPPGAGGYAPGPPAGGFAPTPPPSHQNNGGGGYGTPPPPPRFGSHQGGSLPPTLPLKKRPEDQGGWNDAPATLPTRPKSNMGAGAVPVVTSPFPNSPNPPVTPMSPGMPPPRPGSRGPGAGVVPPPPRAGTGSRPGSVPPPPHLGAPPPGRMVSPPTGGMAGPPPPSGPYAPPPRQGGPAGGFTNPPQPTGQYAPPPPGPQSHSQGPYGPPPPGPPGPGGQSHPGPYGPPPGSGSAPPPQPPPGNPYGPPPPAQGVPNAAVGQIQSPLPPPPAPAPAAAPPKRAGPPPPKYPPGDRTHIPEDQKIIHGVIYGLLQELKSVPQSKRLGDDLEKRINPLFDKLNCGDLSEGTLEGLGELVKAMQAGDKGAALAIHVELITRATQSENLGLPLSAVKQLVVRL